MPGLRTRVASRPSDTNGALQRRTSKSAAPESLTRHEAAARRLSALTTIRSPTGARMVVPVALLQRQATVRVPELLPIRYGRMAVSAFTYFRGRRCPWPATSPTPQDRAGCAELLR